MIILGKLHCDQCGFEIERDEEDEKRALKECEETFGVAEPQAAGFATICDGCYDAIKTHATQEGTWPQ